MSIERKLSQLRGIFYTLIVGLLTLYLSFVAYYAISALKVVPGITLPECKELVQILEDESKFD